MTAPPPRLTAALDAAWDTISEAVATGLDIKQASEDSTLGPLAKVLVADASELPPGGTAPPVKECPPKCIARSDLATLCPQEIQEITEWARTCRYRHLVDVLKALVQVAVPKLDYTEEAVKGATVHGQGGLRLIHLRGDPSVAKKLLNEGRLIQVLDVAAAVSDPAAELSGTCGALLMREFGGPYLYRPQNLTLGWEPAKDELTVRLVLESSWRLERVETVGDQAPVVALRVAPT